MNERAIFYAVLDKDDPVDRAEYLDKVCENNPGLRRDIESLLRSHEEAGDYLEQPLLALREGKEPPTMLGDFRIVREIGRGGMGVVYEAEEVSLGRRVALKVLARQSLFDSKQKERFLRESRAVARLHHTNIVPIFGVGEAEGLMFYVMQLIDGKSLDEVLSELRKLAGSRPWHDRKSIANSSRSSSTVLPADKHALCSTIVRPKESDLVDRDLDEVDVSAAPDGSNESSDGNQDASELPDNVALSGSDVLPGQSGSESGESYWQSVARIGMQVADGLQYAHRQGVVHRDIKPGNLMLDESGTVWITDFGLAKAEDLPDLTKTGDVVGTLRYMAPEAFRGRSDATCDIYSLGLTLYELLARRPAFNETDRHELLRRVMQERPPHLRSLNASIPRDLATIVEKSIDQEAAHRYQSAEELHHDLQRFVSCEPIHARRISWMERTWRWCRRNTIVASLLAALILVLSGGIGVSTYFAVEANERAAAVAEQRTIALGNYADAIAARDDQAAALRLAERRLERAQRAAYGLQLGRARQQLRHDPANAASLVWGNNRRTRIPGAMSMSGTSKAENWKRR